MRQYEGENELTGPVLIVTCGSNIAARYTSTDDVQAALSDDAELGPAGIGCLDDDGEISVVWAGDEVDAHIS
jgi:hypothetical protein